MWLAAHDAARRARRRPDVRPPVRTRSRRARSRSSSTPITRRSTASVAEMLAAGERIDVLATHSKYAPSQAQWLRPLDDLVDTAAVARTGAARGRALPLRRRAALPAALDRRARAVGARRSRRSRSRHVGRARSHPVSRSASRAASRGCSARSSSSSSGAAATLFDAELRPTMATPDAEHAIETLCRLAARAPADLVDWHYDEVDAALLARSRRRGRRVAGRVGRDPRVRTRPLVPHLYPAGPARRVSVRGLPRVGDPPHVRRCRRRGRAPPPAARRGAAGRRRGGRQHVRAPRRARRGRAARAMSTRAGSPSRAGRSTTR